jgi:hypothetical protein
LPCQNRAQPDTVLEQLAAILLVVVLVLEKIGESEDENEKEDEDEIKNSVKAAPRRTWLASAGH